jgi:hypothetical protein
MRRWLFCFQKSVALVLSRLLLSSSQSFPDTKVAIAQYNMEQKHQHQYRMAGSVSPQGQGEVTPRKVRERERSHSHSNSNVAVIQQIMRYNSEISHQNIYGGEDKQKWLTELGHGHGKHSLLANKRNFSMSEDHTRRPSFVTQYSSESIVLSDCDKTESVGNDCLTRQGSSEYDSSGKSSSCIGITSSLRPPALTIPHPYPLPSFLSDAPNIGSSYEGSNLSLRAERERERDRALSAQSLPESPSRRGGRERERDRERGDRYMSRSHSMGNSSEASEDRGYDYFKYGDVTDDDRSISGSDR